MSEGLRVVFARLLFAALILGAWFLDQPGSTGSSSAPLAANGSGLAGFCLEEVAQSLGLDFQHVRPTFDRQLDNIAPQIAALGAAVSVADADGDGRPDLYVTNSAFGQANALFVNRSEGTEGSFEERGAAAGIAQLNSAERGVSMGSVWADMDNDGDEDLFVYRYGYPALFRNDGGLQFREVTEGSGLERWMNSNCAVWFDADQDGLVDLFVAGYFREDVNLWELSTTRIMQDSMEFSSNGGSNVLFRNLGGGHFEDVTESAGLSSNRWTLGAAAADFDADGLVDLYVANDYGAEELYRNLGQGRFERVDAGLGDDSKSGMCVALGDVQNQGRLAVFVTNISERGYLFQGNNLRLNYMAEGAGFLNIAEGAVADCGWAWGAQIGDLDNDGWQDLFVANGFVTGEEGAGSYWYGMSQLGVSAGGLLEDAAHWPSMGGMDLSGSERSRVLLNRNGRLFKEVGEQVGVEDRFDGRAVALVDLGNRGALDVVVANQGGPLVVYRAQAPEGHHWVKFQLRGVSSNRSAIGATVELRAGEIHTVRVVDGGSGFSSQNERRLHFGLGEADLLEQVVVHWPSGQVQLLTGLGVDQTHVLQEPAP